jgi:glycosyltransferase involved in cell wall biosynthesis
MIICDKDVDFSNNIVSLLKDKNRRLEIQQCARKLVESRYDWDVIGKSLTSFLMN